MDLYMTESLQDMLDIDIKSEMDTDLRSTADISDTLGISFSDLPPLPLPDIDMDNGTTWITGTTAMSHGSSTFVHSIDLYGSEANAVMVNPKSVMPSMFSESPIKTSDRDSPAFNSTSSNSTSRSPSPSPSGEKCEDIFISANSPTVLIKNEPEEESAASFDEEEQVINSKFIRVIKKEIKEEPVEEQEWELNLPSDEELINLPKKGTFRIKTVQDINGKTCSILNSNQFTGTQIIKTQNGAQTIISGNIQIIGQQSRTLISNSHKNSTTILIDSSALNNNRQLIKSNNINTSNMASETTKYVPANKLPYCAEFPKPAYSYSCLIAMALKNSRTGSLPVAEIYNFMCQHFPYFKTAPNGWKNSVRHNLSLNKCFEKIEKPSTNGGQRKGCLWAMNPSKVGKMDEEVQKWSRKDPQAIRKAMVRPDSLEALERGEMKFSCENGEDYCSEEEDLDADYLTQGSSSGSPGLVQPYEDETSDVEVMEGVDIEDENKSVMLEFSVSSQFHSDGPAKRPKTNYICQAVSTAPSNVHRRKAPLMNRIA